MTERSTCAGSACIPLTPTVTSDRAAAGQQSPHDHPGSSFGHGIRAFASSEFASVDMFALASVSSFNPGFQKKRHAFPSAWEPQRATGLYGVDGQTVKSNCHHRHTSILRQHGDSWPRVRREPCIELAYRAEPSGQTGVCRRISQYEGEPTVGVQSYTDSMSVDCTHGHSMLSCTDIIVHLLRITHYAHI